MNRIHPTAIVGPDVCLGVNNTIGPYVVISGRVTIADGNWIGAGVVLGAPPEVRSWPHPLDDAPEAIGRGIVVGSRNVIREHAQVHQGWKAVTTLGDSNFIMNQVYIAHDCTVGSSITLASSVLVAGHVVIGDGANVGMGAAIHQTRRIGRGSMVGMGSMVTRDVYPFSKVYGNPARLHGINRLGMERAGVESTAIDALERAYLSADPVDGMQSVMRIPGIDEWLSA